MTRHIITILALVLCTTLRAQRINHVSGQVTASSHPVPGCSVSEVDKTGRVLNSAVTDASGMFTINIHNSATSHLYFSAQGFTSQLAEIKRHVMRVKLETRENKATDMSQVQAVDLGLSVKWADRNIGANAPHECGLYLSWGETQEKDEYYWSSTENYDKCLNYTKYDAAATLWEQRWQMPTNTEVSELISRCIWTWTQLDSIPGYLVTGPSGKSIFLPAYGFRDGTDLKDDKVSGCYWTASPYEGMDDCAYALQVSQERLYRGHRTRSFGFLVRPVWK